LQRAGGSVWLLLGLLLLFGYWSMPCSFTRSLATTVG
jgi:hypothetical protein